jgi:hypothetical protein
VFARLTLIARTIAAWLLAAVVGLFFVYNFPFPAVGFVLLVVSGLGVCYLVIQDEVKLEELPDPLVRERARAFGYQPPLPIWALRFFWQFGLGFMAIGVGGGLYSLSNWVLS